MIMPSTNGSPALHKLNLAWKPSSPGGSAVTVKEAQGVMHATLDASGQLANPADATDMRNKILAAQCESGVPAYLKNFMKKYLVGTANGGMTDAARTDAINEVADAFGIQEHANRARKVTLAEVPEPARSALVKAKSEINETDIDDTTADETFSFDAFYEIKTKDKKIAGYIALGSFSAEDLDEGIIKAYAPDGHFLFENTDFNAD
jgi:hypothetical protein